MRGSNKISAAIMAQNGARVAYNNERNNLMVFVNGTIIFFVYYLEVIGGNWVHMENLNLSLKASVDEEQNFLLVAWEYQL